MYKSIRRYYDKRENRRAEAEDRDNERRLVAEMNDPNHLFKVDRTGKRGVTLSIEGNTAIALRKSLVNVGAYNFGLALLDNISGQTIIRAN